ncbi:MAG: TonB-dependent receptor [Balneolaceae bacterium]|nr:TonB-dependent receptor [Balneolaceae bacterium]
MLAVCLLLPSTVFSQSTGSISGTITSQSDNTPISDANVFIPNTNYGTTTDAEGHFELNNIPAGTYTLNASFIGFEPARTKVQVVAGQTAEATFALREISYKLSGISISALRPDLELETELENQQVREANPRDSGELLRVVAGVDAVRRGPIGLDPVIRGLRETEVGTYLDGTRIFPAGPAQNGFPAEPSRSQRHPVDAGGERSLCPDLGRGQSKCHPRADQRSDKHGQKYHTWKNSLRL